MSEFYTTITDKLQDFIREQKMFFVATAPGDGGRVNVSPKGLDSFRIFDSTSVGYLDLTGSGNETASHVTNNGRITFMFCSFDKQPMILRLYGAGQVLTRSDSKWNERLTQFSSNPGARQIILATIDSVQTSCGFAVPFYSFDGERPTLDNYSSKMGGEKLAQYWSKKNSESIDGLPAPDLR